MLARRVFALLAAVQLVAATPPAASGKLVPIRWWNLALLPDGFDENQLLHDKNGRWFVTAAQQRLLRDNPGLLRSVVDAARLAVDECQHQFRARRWNCSTGSYLRARNIFGVMAQKGTREAAFLFALTNAALTYSISKACADGSIHTCRCKLPKNYPDMPYTYSIHGGSVPAQPYDPGRDRGDSTHNDADVQLNQLDVAANMDAIRSNPAGYYDNVHFRSATERVFMWHGCHDNYKFGSKLASQFGAAMEKGGDMLMLATKHNSAAGRRHAVDDVKDECRCHGMSGTCTHRSCWKRLKPFRLTGDALKDRFDAAVRVAQGNEVRGMRPIGRSRKGHVTSNHGQPRKQRRPKLVPAVKHFKPPEERDLVFFEGSPDFCQAEPDMAFPGTRGRLCNATSVGTDGCQLMCCGRPYHTQPLMRAVRCNCTFQWCCVLNCSTCYERVQQHRCL